ncbi:T9SS type A sorting domain-containing protein [Subsaxibacter sp. CAU 1640]|uniref:T9SS type A sorting domain-containing protein n=1 Tax=Subsaxibacter sp. CAU 1640 TaxID=2933271 RepID=UPI002004354B|nr:T9SS type A sorting domain-containing protein [Subsaxibacter sp. CAU 1640]MCK7590927.1 T9SS type A sorting domain-containing protein [Subsaxibacter sp. CAU 1640]
MRNLSTLVALCLCVVKGISQENVIINGLNNPLGIAVNGDELFICEHHTTASMGSISKINLTDASPVAAQLITGLTYPRAVAMVGDELYYATNYLSKFNINDATPTPQQIMPVYPPRALFLVGNYLYVSGETSIHRLDVTASTPVLTTVISGLTSRTLAFALDGDELYFAYSNRVSKFNVTDANPVEEVVISNLEGNVYALAIYDQKLFIGMSLIPKIVTLDVENGASQVEFFMTPTVGNTVNFLVIGDDLYVAGGTGNSIYKIEDLPTLLSVEESQPFMATKVYPNPTDDIVQLMGLTESCNYDIVNTLGTKVKQGLLDRNGTLDINQLSAGIYYLRLKGASLKAQTFKIVKK